MGLEYADGVLLDDFQILTEALEYLREQKRRGEIPYWIAVPGEAVPEIISLDLEGIDTINDLERTIVFFTPGGI